MATCIECGHIFAEGDDRLWIGQVGPLCLDNPFGCEDRNAEALREEGRKLKQEREERRGEMR